MQFYSHFTSILILLCICAIVPFFALADDNKSTFSPATSQVEIFSGSIPSGDGVVSIKAVSGKLYQIPAMTPLGIIQALAGTDSIDTYKIGDELISKRGILTLDGIDNYVNSGEDSWFVQVNEKQLQDYLLPSEEGLNTHTLKPGDKISFAFGNPTKPFNEATAFIRVTIGTQADKTITTKSGENGPSTQVSDTQTQQSSSTSSASVTHEAQTSPVKTSAPTAETITPIPESTQEKSISGKDLNQPVYDDSEGNSSVTTEEVSSSSTKDPNKPVYGDSEEKSEISTNETSATQTKDPNKPVYEGSEETSDVTPEETQNSELVEKSSSKDNQDTDGYTNETGEKTFTSTVNASKSGQHVLYDGSIKLPSGNVNVTATSGADYDIGADTPLGLLQFLVTDGKISAMTLNDRGMRKGGILAIDSIEDYQYGDEGWFAQVDDVTLQNYTNPGTDGLNIHKIKSGDKVAFFYGKPDQTATSAKAVIYITIE